MTIAGTQTSDIPNPAITPNVKHNMLMLFAKKLRKQPSVAISAPAAVVFLHP